MEKRSFYLIIIVTILILLLLTNLLSYYSFNYFFKNVTINNNNYNLENRSFVRIESKIKTADFYLYLGNNIKMIYHNNKYLRFSDHDQLYSMIENLENFKNINIKLLTNNEQCSEFNICPKNSSRKSIDFRSFKHYVQIMALKSKTI